MPSLLLLVLVMNAFFAWPRTTYAQTPSSPPVSIYVRPVTRSGFVEDKGVLDSVTDLQNEIRKRGNRSKLQLALNRAAAEIVLHVFRRGRDGGNFVIAAIQVGTYVNDVSVSFSGIGDVWGECAEQIIKKINGWIDANRAELRRRREHPSDPGPEDVDEPIRPTQRVRVADGDGAV